VPPGGRGDTPAASAACASAHDLARLGLALLGEPLPDQRPILSRESIAELHRPTTPAWGDDGGYAVGWVIRRSTAGHRRVVAQGGTDSAAALLELLPDERLAVAVVANAGCGLLGDVANRVHAALVPGYPAPEAADEPAVRRGPPPPPAPTPPPAFSPPPELAGRWAGAIHTHEGPRALTLQLGGVEASARLADQPATRIEEPRFRAARLTGWFAGDFGTADTSVAPHRLELELDLRDGRLCGPVVARGAGYALAHWTELTKPGR
jgi:Beta-lactamase